MDATCERLKSTQFFRNNCAGFLYTATQLNAFCFLRYKFSPPLSDSLPAAHNMRNQPHRLIAVSLKGQTAQCFSLTMTTHNLNNFTLMFQLSSLRPCSFFAALHDLTALGTPRQSYKPTLSVFSVAFTEGFECK